MSVNRRWRRADLVISPTALAIAALVVVIIVVIALVS